MRRRLIHCQNRTPFYFQTHFPRVPQQDLEDYLNNPKETPKLSGTINKRINKNLTRKRPVSLTDQNKTHRTAYTNIFLDKDNITRTRHTT